MHHRIPFSCFYDSQNEKKKSSQPSLLLYFYLFQGMKIDLLNGNELCLRLFVVGSFFYYSCINLCGMNWKEINKMVSLLEDDLMTCCECFFFVL